MKIYNTRTHQVEDFTPINSDEVRIYSCGPTVYDHAHIGNLSAYIFADILRRVISLKFHAIKHTMNYTDVDDKTIRRSKENYPDEDPHVALKQLTDKYIAVFLDDMKKIGNDVGILTFLRATDGMVIEGMRQLITELHKKGFAYIADDGIYFSIDAYRKSGKVYGQLIEITAESTHESRIQNDEYDKESASDFALWKKQKNNEPSWEFTLDGHDLSGRPGWHIECSVMSSQSLGQPFDIHTGGVDLIFPHHENEIAQSTAGKENPIMANFFVHNEHILVDGKKMAKSANNFYTLAEIIEKGFNPLAYRLLVLQAHYRSQAHFSWDNLDSAQNRLANFQMVADLRWQLIKEGGVDPENINKFAAQFKDALVDDLNTPLALAAISELFSDIEEKGLSKEAGSEFNDLLELLSNALGLDLRKPDINEEQKQLISSRERDRQIKDWANADTKRQELKEQGIGLNDSDRGPIWYHL